jgi:hypothetical protein
MKNPGSVDENIGMVDNSIRSVNLPFSIVFLPMELNNYFVKSYMIRDVVGRSSIRNVFLETI